MMIIQTRVNSNGGIVKVEYLVKLIAFRGLRSKMQSPNVLGHMTLIGESLP